MQWEYRIELNLGSQLPQRGRFWRWFHEIAPTYRKTNQETWEHPFKSASLAESLNEFGRSGWELVAVVPSPAGILCTLYFFKREKPAEVLDINGRPEFKRHE